MKINLIDTYTDKAAHRANIEKQLEEIDKVLLTPERTLEDIIRHMELIKELNNI